MAKGIRRGSRVVAAALFLALVGGLSGCLGSGSTNGVPSGNFRLSETTVNCPSDTLLVGAKDGRAFPNGTTMIFKNLGTGVSYDGGGMIDPTSGAIGGGLPGNAQAGQYEVIITEPQSQPQNAGTITYTLNGCVGT